MKEFFFMKLLSQHFGCIKLKFNNGCIRMILPFWYEIKTQLLRDEAHNSRKQFAILKMLLDIKIL